MAKIEEIVDQEGGAYPLRVTRRKGRQRCSKVTLCPRVRVKCGCCSEAVDIYVHHGLRRPVNVHTDTLEVNGVLGTVAQWRKVLLPLLRVRPRKVK